MCAFPDGAAEESEVGGGLHFATYAFLDTLFEFGDFGTGVLHGDVVLKCKNPISFLKCKILFGSFLRIGRFPSGNGVRMAFIQRRLVRLTNGQIVAAAA